jgi:hypothetical protein
MTNFLIELGQTIAGKLIRKPGNLPADTIKLPGHPETPEQERLLDEAYNILKTLRPILKTKNINTAEIERTTLPAEHGGGNFITNDKNQRDFAAALLRVFNRQTETGDFKPTVEVSLSSNFSYIKTLEAIGEQITGKKQDLNIGAEHDKFLDIIYKNHFNIIIDIEAETDPQNTDIQKFANLIRGEVETSNDEMRVVTYLGKGASDKNLPSEIGRLY